MVKIRTKNFTISKAVKPGETHSWIPFYCELCARKLRANDTEYGLIKPCPGCKQDISFPDPSFGVGQMIAEYMIDGWISHGSMGEVYMAHNTNTNNKVALKLLNSQLASEDGVKLFKQECDLLSFFRHPNIVGQNGSGEYYGCHYLAMDYVEGECIDQVLKRYDTLPEKMVLSMIRQLADALDYVWTRFGIRHRDIKPGNLMIDEVGNVTLIDWGMAKQKYYNADEKALGSPLFMDPVTFSQNTGLDCRSDIYSMGVTAFHLLTGDYPFIDEDIDVLIDKVINEPAPLACAINPEVSELASQLISYMMEKTYETRYQNWAEVLDGVNQVIAQQRF
jgi:eukaryotic-like serine/threonine-protein kinase